MDFIIIIYLITSFLLSKTTSYDQEKFNNIYSQRFIKDYRYIDKEISAAKEKYGIEYDAKTITTLKKWLTKSSVEQVSDFKKSLSRETKASLDTIILQKIVIHNYKKGSWNDYKRNSLGNWHYALPKDILHQIGLHKNNSNETKELFNLLKEQTHLINTPRIEWDNYKNYTETERRISDEIQ